MTRRVWILKFNALWAIPKDPLHKRTLPLRRPFPSPLFFPFSILFIAFVPGHFQVYHWVVTGGEDTWLEITV